MLVGRHALGSLIPIQNIYLSITSGPNVNIYFVFLLASHDVSYATNSMSTSPIKSKKRRSNKILKLLWMNRQTSGHEGVRLDIYSGGRHLTEALVISVRKLLVLCYTFDVC